MSDLVTGAPGAQDRAETFSVSGMSFSHLDGCLWLNGERVRLTSLELRFLLLFLRNPGRTIEKITILEQLYRHTGKPISVELKLLDVLACKVRKKLKSAGADHPVLNTVWGQGYVLGDPDPQAVDQWPPDLPPRDARWVPSRKMKLVDLVLTSRRTAEDIVGHYPGLSLDTLDRWTRIVQKYGPRGLRTTRSQVFPIAA